jgi:hypothetical protein
MEDNMTETIERIAKNNKTIGRLQERSRIGDLLSEHGKACEYKEITGENCPVCKWILAMKIQIHCPTCISQDYCQACSEYSIEASI